MPKYDYRCTACSHEFEAEHRISADPLKDCPSCNKPALERLISRTSFSLKGGGWYKDSYSAGRAPDGSTAIGTSRASNSAKENGDKIAEAIKKSDGKSDSKSDSET